MSILNALVGMVLLIFFGTCSGILCIASSALFVASTRKSTARRYVVNFRHYRPCKKLQLSSHFLWHRNSVEYFRWLAVALVVTASFVDYETSLLRYLNIAWMSALIVPILFAASLSLLKYWIDTNFRIVVFRRNLSSLAFSHKAEVMPACGLYGQVLLLTDDTLSAAWEGGRTRLTQWVFSEMYQPLWADPTSDEWRNIVVTELSFADFVLFDWSGEVSNNMRWELEETLKWIPLNRILIVSNGQSTEIADGILRSSLLGGSASFASAVSPSDEFSQVLFRRSIERAFASLGVDRRLQGLHGESQPFVRADA